MPPTRQGNLLFTTSSLVAMVTSVNVRKLTLLGVKRSTFIPSENTSMTESIVS